ncbi:MAG: nuclear transport factor 2 family protein [Gemmatimonadetes bacterium]|jgi:ketosteroid isomerase-like protein|nr:nuclear transport factor 2 family protein [Gemmatimonadota bacterium]
MKLLNLPLRLLALTAVLAFAGTPTFGGAQEAATPLQRQVMQAELAFARTMADRDAEAFAGFVSEEAVFFGDRTLRGRAEVTAGWSRYFDGPEAPFSWRPESVEVLASGKLALSTGPVFDAAGKRIGTFNSVWRLESDGHWRVVFDKGCPAP